MDCKQETQSFSVASFVILKYIREGKNVIYIRRGTTPSWTISVTGITLSDYPIVWLTFKQFNNEITLTQDNLTITNNEILAELTQTQTLSFCAGGGQIQLRVFSSVTSDAEGSEKYDFEVLDILKDGEIA